MNVTGEQARNFLGKPTLGGWLTIANCCAWAALMIGSQRMNPSSAVQDAFAAAQFALSVPLALCCLFGERTFYDIGAVVIFAVTVGINSIVWGYGIEAIVRWNTGQRDKRREVQRGFEVLPVAEEIDQREHRGHGEED